MRETQADSTAVLPPDDMVSIGHYPLRQADTEDRFYGNRLIYLGWDNHLMYCAPFVFPCRQICPLVHWCVKCCLICMVSIPSLSKSIGNV